MKNFADSEAVGKMFYPKFSLFVYIPLRMLCNAVDVVFTTKEKLR